MTLAQIIEKLKMEHARSMEKHGKWKDVSSLDQADAIAAEYDEWERAYYSGDIHGEHGEIVELVQVMNVAARRIMYLTGEDQ